MTRNSCGRPAEAEAAGGRGLRGGVREQLLGVLAGGVTAGPRGEGLSLQGLGCGQRAGQEVGEGRLSVCLEAGGVSEQVLCSGASLHPSRAFSLSPVLDSSAQQDGPSPHRGPLARQEVVPDTRERHQGPPVETTRSSWVGGAFEEEADLDRAGGGCWLVKEGDGGRPKLPHRFPGKGPGPLTHGQSSGLGKGFGAGDQVERRQGP